MTGPAYAELGAMSNFSFLEGASHPPELILQAAHVGIAAIGLADRNSLAGMVRAHKQTKKEGARLIVGCRLGFTDGTELIVFPRDRAAYGRLCRLLSLGKSEIVPQEPPASATILPFRRPGEGRGPCLSPSAMPSAVAREMDTGLRRDDGAEGNVAVLPQTPSPHGSMDGEEGSMAKARITKGETHLSFDQARSLGEGMIALVPAPADPDAGFVARLERWALAWPDRLHLAVAPLWRGDDRARIARLAAIAEAAGAPMVATNAVLYHHPERRQLQDVLACVRAGTTIDTAGYLLEANAERYLKRPAEMARAFIGHEAAIERTVELAGACRFSLDELAYIYPDEPVPLGWTPQQHLTRLAWQGAKAKWPRGLPQGIEKIIAKELGLIRQLGYANYFLTVHDIVAWARAQQPPILCQGRGSAANSVVCYCLDITAVDPTKQQVLIERFISADRKEPPDIDVDFEHERREEVMQYIYRRYGRARAAIVATVIHYRPRSAIRDVGKALGLTEDVTSRLADTIWGSFGRAIEDAHVDQTGVDRTDPRLALALDLTRQLLTFPRHLSQHVGGFVLTNGSLIETVPIGNGAMADRTFIEWDKDDIDELKIMKVDVLALGMLTALRKGFDLIASAYGPRLELHTVPQDLPRVYDMLCRADSLGVFQVESRAQMAMLPRMRPREFYDLVVEVAIVRPGPIQGKMVHPYLANRKAKREAEARGQTYEYPFPSPAEKHGPKDELKNILGKTLGVPLFQEQAMRIAMDAAKFTGGEANELRKAMATFRRVGTIGLLERRMVGKMIERGYDPEFANNCFGQIKGFGEYGFPESHAASFAHLVYISSWMKCDYPEVFAAALLNSQPMGFYAPAQIVRDARAHGVEVRPPDVSASDWDCTLEAPPAGTAWHPTGPQEGVARNRHALRLGLRQIGGFRKDWAEDIALARANAPFASLDDLRRRAGLPAQALDKLASADALGGVDLSRRQGLWAASGVPRMAPAPLFEAAGIEEGDGSPPAALPRLSAGEEVVGDYQTIRLSLKGHPVAFLRDRLTAAGAIPSTALETVRDGRRVKVAGVVLVRQRPGTAKGVVFITVEDESGVANLVLWPNIFENFRPIAMGARMLFIHGRVQRADGVTHVVVDRLEDWGRALGELSHAEAPASETGSRRHPRDVRVIPQPREFH
jgi:error-prone DNA polymerase